MTALSRTNTAEGWRESGTDNGILLDEKGDVLVDGLSLPHSPVLANGELYLVEAGRGRLLSFDGSVRVIAELNTVARGLSMSAGYYFVGGSRIRASSGDAALILTKRLTDASDSHVIAISRPACKFVYFKMKHVTEVSSVTFIPKPTVKFIALTPQQRAQLFIYIK